MSRGLIVEVSQVIGSRRLGAFNLTALLLGALIMMVDGVDYVAAIVGAPAIMRAFASSNETMGLVFGAGNLGLMLGGLGFANLGDRIGRKWTSVIAILLFSLASLGCAIATGPEELMLWRFFVGLGVGGATIMGMIYLTECAPLKFRSAFVMIGVIAYILGASGLALLSRTLIPIWGWRSIFVVPGLIGLALAVIAAVSMRESLLFLASRRPTSPDLKCHLKRLAPELDIQPDTRFVLSLEPRADRGSFRALFSGALKLGTPLLWGIFLVESLATVSLGSWFLVIMTQFGFNEGQAALVYSYNGGIQIFLCVGLLLTLDRLSLLVPALLALFGTISLLVLAGGPATQPMVIAASAIALACSAALHSALMASVSTFYPTDRRANGVALALVWGRVGMISGPVAMGFLLTTFPLTFILVLMAGLYSLVALMALCLGVIFLKTLRKSAI